MDLVLRRCFPPDTDAETGTGTTAWGRDRDRGLAGQLAKFPPFPLLSKQRSLLAASMRAVRLLLVALVLGALAADERRNPKRSSLSHRLGQAAGQQSEPAGADVVEAGAFGCLGREANGVRIDGFYYPLDYTRWLGWLDDPMLCSKGFAGVALAI